jgi:pimeloyl-ACP methyl ester carboxylesterase
MGGVAQAGPGGHHAERQVGLAQHPPDLDHAPPDEFAAAMLPSMFSPSVKGEVVATFAGSVRAFRPGGFRTMAGASFEDQSYVLPEVDVPALLLYADHHVRAPVAVGEAIHAMVRGSQLVVLLGPGHVSSVEAPNDVTRELRRFLRSVE